MNAQCAAGLSDSVMVFVIYDKLPFKRHRLGYLMSETQLRSHQWFGRHDLMGFTNRSWMKNQGHAEHLFDGRPVIGICNT